MPHLPAAAHQRFATQHGVASVPQLHDAGLSRRQLDRLESEGAIELVLRGVYRTPSVPVTELGRCAAACLANPYLAIAGPTAGRIWGFRRLPHDARTHVLAPPASNPAIARWVTPYRTAAVHPCDILERPDGIRLTSRARTAFDLARCLKPDDLLSVIEQAMHDGNLDERDLRAVAVDWLSPQRRWAWTFLRQLDRRLAGGPAESHAEVLVADRLRRAGVRGLVRQFEVRLPGYGPARFDLAHPRLRWAIEVDIFPTHDESIGRQRDRRRDAAAAIEGWFTTRLDRHTYEHRLNDWVERMTVQQHLLPSVDERMHRIRLTRSSLL
ncbi:MAG: type IV toxin-antitoxin system AbiEi family antitoxin domain-containing protein [Ilumatobacteraceae bacterium]